MTSDYRPNDASVDNWETDNNSPSQETHYRGESNTGYLHDIGIEPTFLHGDDRSPLIFDSTFTSHISAATVDDSFVNNRRMPTIRPTDDAVNDGSAAGLMNLHCHSRPIQPDDRRAQWTLGVVSFITAIFVVAQFTGGFLADSLAIMTDAGHLLTDLLGFLISILAIIIAKRPATKRLSFGFYRAEVLGAVCSILIIWVLTGVLVYLAVRRIIEGDYKIEPTIMLVTAGGGLVFNIIMGAILHFGGGGFGHHHGHSHGGGATQRQTPDNHPAAAEDVEQGSPTDNNGSPISDSSNDDDELGTRRRSVTAYPNEDVLRTRKKKDRNINVRAAMIHVIGDLVQSVGVLLAAVLIEFEPSWKIADPICTFVFSGLVLITTFTVLRDALTVLMEGTPRDVNFDDIHHDLLGIEGVTAAHNLHMWSLTIDKAALAVHLAIDAGVDPVIVMRLANKMIRHKYNVHFATIQVEPYEPLIMTKCTECTGPKQ